MLIRIYDKNPSEREIARTVDALRRDGVVIYPTDSVYAYGCSLQSPRALERLRRLSGKELNDLSLVFDSLSRVAEYCRVDNETFRILRRNLPGPFTFLLNASSRIPDKALSRRKVIGVRIPDNAIVRALVETLDAPLVTASLKNDGAEEEYMTDPELIHERHGGGVALVIDGGAGSTIPTAVVDLTGDEPELLREGPAELQ